VKNWNLGALDVQPRSPVVLSSTSEARALALFLPAGDGLADHQVHERAGVLVVEGELEIQTTDGARLTGGAGLLTEFDPSERHAVLGRQDTRLLVLLTPWPAASRLPPTA